MSTYRDAIEYLTARAALSNKHESDLTQVNHASTTLHKTFTEFEDIRFKAGQILEKNKTLLELNETLRTVNEEWRLLAERSNKGVVVDKGTVVWVVERNFKTPEMNSDDWRYLAYPNDTDNEMWDSDWNVAIKCYDRSSAVRLTHYLYDEWIMRVTDHLILDARLPK